jgi:hypothetical protein
MKPRSSLAEAENCSSRDMFKRGAAGLLQVECRRNFNSSTADAPLTHSTGKTVAGCCLGGWRSGLLAGVVLAKVVAALCRFTSQVECLCACRVPAVRQQQYHDGTTTQAGS